jgi:hypothetical protein
MNADIAWTLAGYLWSSREFLRIYLQIHHNTTRYKLVIIDYKLYIFANTRCIKKYIMPNYHNIVNILMQLSEYYDVYDLFRGINDNKFYITAIYQKNMIQVHHPYNGDISQYTSCIGYIYMNKYRIGLDNRGNIAIMTRRFSDRYYLLYDIANNTVNCYYSIE